MRTIMTDMCGELPVIETWKQCRHTKTGWRGICENGEIVNMVYDPKVNPSGRARMPDQDYVIMCRDGKVVGAVLIERARRRAKR
jgi:hypothetical protein